ncbi:DUF817 domain-containing protein [Gymnodinialimonas sp. 2305UL16-5]|uniref:DUF817 domain-containing protein n=1 Tax=Gymnodinialimonas mytili TaxID=3126503 RepID=UPI00309583A7
MADKGVAYLERTMGDWARARLHPHVAEFAMFVLKQGWAALFGILMLAAIILSRLIWQADWTLARYDALFLFAIATQSIFLWLRLESIEEAKVILLFHITGTIMEVFKLAQGSWDYPDQGVMEIGGVPMFSGFMYASVGSFMARVIRIFHMEFSPYPSFALTVALATAIYVNFFTHHYTYDIRWFLFAATLVLFWRTRIWFFPGPTPRWMPLPVAAFLSAIFLWIAENIGTLTQTWTYAGQGTFELVDLSKFGSWYLLLYVSFVTVSLVLRDVMQPDATRPAPREVYQPRASQTAHPR